MEKKELFVVDRIEGDIAVCVSDESGETMDFPTAIIKAPRENDYIEVTLRISDGITEIINIQKLSKEEVRLHKKDNRARLTNLFENN